MRRKRFKPPKLDIDYSAIETVVNNETQIILTNKILKQFKLSVDKRKN